MTETQTAVVEKPKRKMRAGGGKAKGNGFESVIAKELTKGLQPLNFIRTPGSGARVGGKNFATIGAMFGEDALKIFVGDVTPVNERVLGLRFLATCECKFYATQDHFTAVMKGTGKIFGWMKEAEDDATKVSKKPVLIFKWNHTPIFVASTADMPPSVVKMILPRSDGSKIFVAELDALLKHHEFWYERAWQDDARDENPNPQ